MKDIQPGVLFLFLVSKLPKPSSGNIYPIQHETGKIQNHMNSDFKITTLKLTFRCINCQKKKKSWILIHLFHTKRSRVQLTNLRESTSFKKLKATYRKTLWHFIQGKKRCCRNIALKHDWILHTRRKKILSCLSLHQLSNNYLGILCKAETSLAY